MSVLKKIIAITLLLLALPCSALALVDNYVFERMWPNLQQPWYFDPFDLDVDTDGNIYLTNWGSSIIKLNQEGQVITVWKGGITEGAGWTNLRGIAIGPNGYVYAVDSGRSLIQKFTLDGQFVSSWGGWGSGNGQFMFYDTLNDSAEESILTVEGAGIAVDQGGNVYVADTANNRIQKFDSNGGYITQWSQGADYGELDRPIGIDVDNSGNVYVVDTFNNRVVKFDSDGGYINKWGEYDTGGSVEEPLAGGLFSLDNIDNSEDHVRGNGIYVDDQGYVYVSDYFNNRIQKFTADGTFVDQQGVYGPENGNFLSPKGIAGTREGFIFVVETGNNRVQKFTADFQYVTKWGSTGTENGYFNDPMGIAVDSIGNVYVADAQLQLIQKFSANGQFLLEWIHDNTDFGNFSWVPDNVAIDTSPHDGLDYVYVPDAWDRIQKFDTSGTLKAEWGSLGPGPGQFNFGFGHGVGMAFDNDHYLYIADINNNRIQKWAPPETAASEPHTFSTSFGEYGTGNDQFNFQYHGIAQLAIDKTAEVLYVADPGNGRVQKLNLDGSYIATLKRDGWDKLGAAPRSVAVDAVGNVFVGCGGDNEIHVFNPNGTFNTAMFKDGSAPGQLSYPYDMAFSPTNNKLYVADSFNQRVQVFKPITEATGSKAIVVAGGGPFPGNNLWTATQSNANFAYRTLTFQGFTKDTIYYLSADTDFDLDGNGELDDIDDDATLLNLEYAIKTWAAGANDVVLYLVDHGGSGTFRISGTETLDAAVLDAWLDSLQVTITGTLTVIYDACEAGSFVSLLAPPAGYELSRVTITSTSPGESAYFISQGSISFSNYFWTHTFNGVDVYNAYTLTSDSIGFATPYQHPLLDANGNGTANETEDATLTQNTYIGSGTLISGEVPVIGSISSDQTIDATATAQLLAYNVTDDDGIARVWAVIRPPDYGQGGSDNTVQELPSIDLLPVGSDDRYEANYNDFNLPGSYNIAIYARDRIGNTAVPKLTTVSVTNPLSRKAIIVAGSWQDDTLWPSIETNVSLAYNALSFQGYTDDDIFLFSPVAISGLQVDDPPTLSGLENVITTWALNNTQDLVIYLIGNSGGQKFKLNQTERLAGSALNTWLDDLQATMTGTVTLVYDASQSGAFLPALAPPTEKERILIASAAANESANFLSQGVISFSNFFWRQVLNGASVRDSFIYARKAMAFLTDDQTPLLDDNGNGIGNEKTAGSVDGLLARYFTLGTGIMLAGNEPLIGSVSADYTLTGGGASAAIWAGDVTTTGTIDQVWAVITPPGSHDIAPAIPTPYTDLTFDPGTGRYEGTYTGFTTYGVYTITFFASDIDGNVSMPISTRVTQTDGPDMYENDDTAAAASVIFVDDIYPQTHTFHDEGDADWVKFYALQGQIYTIEVPADPDSSADVVIELFNTNGTSLLAREDTYGTDGGDFLDWTIDTGDGVYFIRITEFSGSSGDGFNYGLKVYRPFAPDLGIIQGIIYSGLDLSAISGAIITAGLNTAAISLADGTFQLSVKLDTEINLTSIFANFVSATISSIVVTAGETTQVELSVLPAGMGDLNDDQITGLADAILAMQIITGNAPAYTITVGSDINNDSKIGIKEVLYILQKVSGVRE